MMKLLEIEQEAKALSESDRAALIITLIETLPAPAVDVTDEEAMQRDAELESGVVAPLEREEFVQRVQKVRLI